MITSPMHVTSFTTSAINTAITKSSHHYVEAIENRNPTSRTEEDIAFSRLRIAHT